MAKPFEHMNKKGAGEQASQPKPGGDYDKDAHGPAAHGRGGEAVGQKGDIKPMEYSTKTHAEGAESQPVAGHESGKGDVGLAEHHGNHGGAPHQFNGTPAPNAHGYGHPAHVRQGALRNSGHSGAHRIGKK